MASVVRVKPDQLESAVSKILEEYFEGVQSGTYEAVATVAAETVADLQSASPQDKGKYAKSWRIKQTKEQKGLREVTIYNTQYQLTHLLEHGHIKVVHNKTLGFTAARPHITKAEQKANKKLESKIIKVVQTK